MRGRTAAGWTGVVAAALTALASGPAHAYTTVFSDMLYEQTGVVGALDAVGNPNGNAAASMAAGSSLTLQWDRPLTGAGLRLYGMPGADIRVVEVSIGAIVGGTAVFSAPSAAASTGGPFGALDLSAECAALTLDGCSLVRIVSIFTSSGAPILLDGVGAFAATPEPSVWALAILAFAGLALRMKAARRTGAARGAGAIPRPRPAFGPMPAPVPA